MINNQLQSPVAGKNSMIPGQGGAEGKNDPGTQKGGLFKLLMSSVQGEAGSGNGKGNKNGAANILGGNLTLGNGKDGNSKQSALQLLSGSGEETGDGEATLSKLLNGTAESANGGDDAGLETETADENVEADTQTGDEAQKETDGSDTEGAKVTEGKAAETDGDSSKDVTTEGVDVDTAEAENTTDSMEAADGKNIAAGKNGEPLAAGDTAAASQAVAASGESKSANSTSGNSNSNSNSGSETVTAKAQHQTIPQNGQIQGEDVVEGEATQNGSVNGSIPVAEGIAETGGAAESDLNGRAGVLKSEGLVNELRAMAAAQGEHLSTAARSQERLTPDQLKTDAATEDAALPKELFNALQSGSIEQIAAEIRSMRAGQVREAKFSNYLANFANRQDLSGGSTLSAGSGTATSSGQAGGVSTMAPVAAMVPTGTSVSSELFDENASVLWKEQITEYFESKDKTASENQAAAAFARLGDVAVTNISVRKSFAQGISKAILSSAAQGSKGSDVWQKHNFVLEDGKNIQVAAREVDGVLQLKLSSSASELNKLLMEHEKEIRELLENELELKVDLQMDGGGDGNVADFFGGSSGRQSSGRDGKGQGPLDLGSLRRTKEQEVDEVVPKAVRKFGYNFNEWTV